MLHTYSYEIGGVSILNGPSDDWVDSKKEKSTDRYFFFFPHSTRGRTHHKSSYTSQHHTPHIKLLVCFYCGCVECGFLAPWFCWDSFRSFLFLRKVALSSGWRACLFSFCRFFLFYFEHLTKRGTPPQDIDKKGRLLFAEGDVHVPIKSTPNYNLQRLASSLDTSQPFRVFFPFFLEYIAGERE